MTPATLARRASLCAALLALLTAYACSTDVQVGYDNAAPGAGGSAAGAGESSAGSSTGGAGGAAPCVPTKCRDMVFQCGNCQDDDQDGRIDALDPDCLGPCDDSEDTFFRPTQGDDGCPQDCYFDKNAGFGNDRCLWSHACDPESVAPDYPPSGDAACVYNADTKVQNKSCADLRATQAATCLESCLPLTPNGCDCFGCCELPAHKNEFVWLGTHASGSSVGTCNSDSVASGVGCASCTPVLSCFNPCEGCEVCVGEVAPRPGCDEDLCDADSEPCGPNAECPATFYCITGCCVPAPR